jgi:hypothetical protein
MMAAYLIQAIACTSLIVVPSVGLGVQLEQDFVSWFGPNKVETVTTDRVRKGKVLAPIRIVTI